MRTVHVNVKFAHHEAPVYGEIPIVTAITMYLTTAALRFRGLHWLVCAVIRDTQVLFWSAEMGKLTNVVGCWRGYWNIVF